MSEIREIWSSFDGSSEENNIPLRILEAQVEAINKQKTAHQLFGSIVTVTGTRADELKHVLYLIPIYSNGYNYRYIEFSQQVDNFFPIHISAFQQGNTDFGVANSESEIYDALTKIFNDVRTRIVFSQLKSMSNTAKNWNDEL